MGKVSPGNLEIIRHHVNKFVYECMATSYRGQGMVFGAPKSMDCCNSVLYIERRNRLSCGDRETHGCYAFG